MRAILTSHFPALQKRVNINTYIFYLYFFCIIPYVYTYLYPTHRPSQTNPTTSSSPSLLPPSIPRPPASRAVEAIFASVEAADEAVEFTLRVSYVEIYMERIRDLLNPKKTAARPPGREGGGADCRED